MRRFAAFFVVLILIVIAAASTRCAYAEASWKTGACGDEEGNTHNNSWFSHQERVCELRTATIKLGGQHLNVKSENGATWLGRWQSWQFF